MTSTLQADLRSKRTEDRIRAVNRLIRSDLPERNELLVSSLSDRSHYIAALAAEALAESADMASCRAMVERFDNLSEDGVKRDPGCHIRAHLAYAFGRLEYQGAIESLRMGIKTVQVEAVGGKPFDTGTHLRANCALALAQLHAPDALRDIALLLFETAPEWARSELPPHEYDQRTSKSRVATAEALRRLGDPAAITIFALKLKAGNPDKPEVLQECILSLAEMEDPRIVESAGPYLSSEDEHLAAYAGLMLARTRQPDVAPLLLSAAFRLTGEPRDAVIIALSSMRTPESNNALLVLLSDERSAIRLAAATGLADTSDPSLLKRLAEMAETDPSPEVRDAARPSTPGPLLPSLGEGGRG